MFPRFAPPKSFIPQSSSQYQLTFSRPNNVALVEFLPWTPTHIEGCCQRLTTSNKPCNFDSSLRWLCAVKSAVWFLTHSRVIPLIHSIFLFPILLFGSAIRANFNWKSLFASSIHIYQLRTSHQARNKSFLQIPPPAFISHYNFFSPIQWWSATSYMFALNSCT